MNVIYLKRTHDTDHEGKIKLERDRASAYALQLGLPHMGLEGAADLSTAVKRGSVIIAHRLADLDLKPSTIVPALQTAVALGRTIHVIELGAELTGLLPVFRAIAAAWSPLEDRIAELERTAEALEAHHDDMLKRFFDLAVKKVSERMAYLPHDFMVAKREAAAGKQAWDAGWEPAGEFVPTNKPGDQSEPWQPIEDPRAKQKAVKQSARVTELMKGFEKPKAAAAAE